MRQTFILSPFFSTSISRKSHDAKLSDFTNHKTHSSVELNCVFSLALQMPQGDPTTDDFAVGGIGNLKFIFTINLISVKHEIEVNGNFLMKFDTFLERALKWEEISITIK